MSAANETLTFDRFSNKLRKTQPDRLDRTKTETFEGSYKVVGSQIYADYKARDSGGDTSSTVVLIFPEISEITWTTPTLQNRDGGRIVVLERQ